MVNTLLHSYLKQIKNIKELFFEETVHDFRVRQRVGGDRIGQASGNPARRDSFPLLSYKFILLNQV